MLHHIIIFLCSLLMVATGIAMYTKGETDTKWLGKSYKEFKYALGIPIGILGAIALHSWFPLWAILTYFLATWGIPYGEKSPITKLIGDRWAVTIAGIGLGCAAFPVIGLWAILSGIISGGMFYWLNVMNGKINEPYVAIMRGVFGLCLILFLSLVR